MQACQQSQRAENDAAQQEDPVKGQHGAVIVPAQRGTCTQIAQRQAKQQGKQQEKQSLRELHDCGLLILQTDGTEHDDGIGTTLALHHADDQHRTGRDQHQNGVQDRSGHAGGAGAVVRKSIGVDADVIVVFLVQLFQPGVVGVRDQRQAGKFKVVVVFLVRKPEGLAVFVENVWKDVKLRPILGKFPDALLDDDFLRDRIPAPELHGIIGQAIIAREVGVKAVIPVAERLIRFDCCGVELCERPVAAQKDAVAGRCPAGIEILHLLPGKVEISIQHCAAGLGKKSVRQCVPAGVPCRLIGLEDAADGVEHVRAQVVVAVRGDDRLPILLTKGFAVQRRLGLPAGQRERIVRARDQNRPYRGRFRNAHWAIRRIDCKIVRKGDVQLLRCHILRLDRRRVA